MNPQYPRKNPFEAVRPSRSNHPQFYQPVSQPPSDVYGGGMQAPYSHGPPVISNYSHPPPSHFTPLQTPSGVPIPPGPDETIKPPQPTSPIPSGTLQPPGLSGPSSLQFYSAQTPSPGFEAGSSIGGTGRLSPQMQPVQQPDDVGDYENEPPLLEELGINLDHIAQRMKSVVLSYKLDHDLLIDCDMTGPLLIALCLGFCLLLRGKIHFGYIYGLGIVGCLSAYILLNLMSQIEAIDLYRTISILGYGLMPVVGLAFASLFTSLRGTVGLVMSVVCILWCTLTASRFFESALRMQHQRFLVAYPIGMLYTCFVLITVF